MQRHCGKGKAVRTPLDLMTLVQDKEMCGPEDAVHVKYAEFYDGTGRLVAKFSGSGWIRMSTADTQTQQLDEYSLYRELWAALANASMRRLQLEKNRMALPAKSREREYYDIYEEEVYIVDEDSPSEKDDNALEDRGFDRKA